MSVASLYWVRDPVAVAFQEAHALGAMAYFQNRRSKRMLKVAASSRGEWARQGLGSHGEGLAIVSTVPCL